MTRGRRKIDDSRELLGERLTEVRTILLAHTPGEQRSRWSIPHLAALIHVDKGTLSRVFHGKCHIARDSLVALIRLFEEGLMKMDNVEVSRREMLIKGLKALLVTSVAATVAADGVATLGATPMSPITSKRQAPRIDIAAYEDHLENWRKLLYQGSGKDVLRQASRYFSMLNGQDDVRDDAELAILASRIGMMKARAEEVVFPWEAACAHAVQTYNEIEQGMLRPAIEGKPNRRKQLLVAEYAKLLDSRSRMSRRLGQFSASIRDARQVVKLSSELAQQRGVELEPVAIDARFKYAHILACLGLEDHWLRELARAGERIESLEPSLKEEYQTYLTYYYGEGYKRLAFDPYARYSVAKRQEFARLGLENLNKSRLRVSERWYLHESRHEVVGFHPLYTQLGEIQCQLWSDPQVAQDQLAELETEANRNFPALLDKIKFSETIVDRIVPTLSRKPRMESAGVDLDAISKTYRSDAAIARHLVIG